MLLWTLALIGIGLDQTTKYGMFAWLKERPQEYHTASVFTSIRPWFALQARHIYDRERGVYEPQVNSGRAFRLARRLQGSGQQRFAVISLLAALAIVYWVSRPGPLGISGSASP